MGLFKQMKDMKKTVEAAPGMIQEAQQLAARAQQMAAAQQAAAQQPAVTGGPEFEPIAGVSLDQYADISKGLAAYGYDQSKAVDVAASRGVSSGDWQQAVDGWNARMVANPAVAQQFNKLYVGR
jgi:hypothetical protein